MKTVDLPTASLESLSIESAESLEAVGIDSRLNLGKIVGKGSTSGEFTEAGNRLELASNFSIDDKSSNAKPSEANCSNMGDSIAESMKSSISRASISSSASDESVSSSIFGAPNKPHKANDTRWEAIQVIRVRDGVLGLSHFRLLKRLGCGDIGSVYLSELCSSKCHFAMKVMDKSSLASRKKLLRAQTEREILASLDHPFLPTLYAHFETDKFSCLVMEYCPGGDLHTLRQQQAGKHFSELAARYVNLAFQNLQFTPPRCFLFFDEKALGLLQPLPIPDKPWESIAMDFMFDLPRTPIGNDGIWTIICRFRKQAHFVLVKKKIKLEHIVKLFMHNIFKYHGMPQSIVSDRDLHMTSLFWKALFENMGTSLKFSSSFHPQTDVCRGKFSVLDLLKCYVSEHKATWEHDLPLFEYAYNNTVHTSTRKAPFEIVEGRLRKTKGKERLFFKLGMCDYGPFQICDKINDVAYSLKLPESLKIHNAFHVSLLRPFVDDVPEILVPEKQLEVEDFGEILVPEQILAHNKRKVRGKFARSYLVKFKNYSPMDAKWMEEVKFVDSPQLLQLYLEAFQLHSTVT
ncbi:hypothetical protein L7F22_065065 [Adiantum nelumboides]|nr:hypothetical protein [Adiantum nelumboides]